MSYHEQSTYESLKKDWLEVGFPIYAKGEFHDLVAWLTNFKLKSLDM